MRPTSATLLAALLAAGCSPEKDPAPDPQPTACTPAEVRACFGGPAGTQGVGTCHAGTQTCAADGSGFGPCEGEVVPVAEVCGNAMDDDCNGVQDDVADADGDGWTRCDGDCDDAAAEVNPGAYDFAGDGVDDDCSGAADDGATNGCSAARVHDASAAQLAAAFDLCQVTTANPPLAQRRWGMISAALTLADGTGAPEPVQASVLTGFGWNVTPRSGPTLAVLSTGTARGPTEPGYVSPFDGYSAYTSSVAPGALLAAHGGALPTFDCWPAEGTTVYDPVRLALELRVPTNAHGLRFASRFYASDFPQTVCSKYNDAFLAGLAGAAEGIPADGVVTLTPQGHVITVNDGMIQSCTTTPERTCVLGSSALFGTGYLQGEDGGATSWLVTSAPVVPGETVTLSFTIWDTGDHVADSAVLLDGFRWLQGVTPLDTYSAGN